ncbi:MAG TPA: hypothetical protein VGM32_00135 [Rhodopila sp.]
MRAADSASAPVIGMVIPTVTVLSAATDGRAWPAASAASSMIAGNSIRKIRRDGMAS